MIKVTIFNEFYHEKVNQEVKAIYPDGIHIALKNQLEVQDINDTTVTRDDENCGITDELLENTDVLIWWGHIKHNLVSDDVVTKIKTAVNNGMGAIFLHSAHYSKPFKALLGTSCNLTWREDGDSEFIWCCNPYHPIAKGIDSFIYLEKEETYGEPFCIPNPDEIVFLGSFQGGEAFRSGCCWNRGGKIFYFQPGHETYPTFYNKDVIKVIKNAIHWAYSQNGKFEIGCPKVEKPMLRIKNDQISHHRNK